MTKVLIVDDDAVNAAFIKEVLAKAYPLYTYTIAGGGQEALDMISEDIPDIILLDVLMPVMSGFEVCERLKTDETLRSIPVLMITGLDSIEEMVKGFKLGAADYITKPINVEELKARVDAHLRIKQYHDELVRTQAALIESAKMSAVGSLSAGVAHEFNNILVMMSGYLQLYHTCDKTEDLQKTMQIIAGLVKRGEKIVKGLLDFSRREEYQRKETADVKELLQHNLSLLEREFTKNDILVESFLDEEVPPLRCYPGQVSQVLVNVIRNAVDAVKDAETKKIRIALSETGSSGTEGVDDQGVVISVSDTGNGIPPHIHEKIFEPFVTTKGVVGGGDDSSPGTGLGLSLSYGIMQRHKGYIKAENLPSGGARIDLFFFFF